MDKLVPCPFCGCNDRKVGIRKMGAKGYRVICGNCGAGGSYVAIADFGNKVDAQLSAMKAWNKSKK